MPIPEFEVDGKLPRGDEFGEWDGAPIYMGHECTYSEIKDRLVTHYPDSLTRPYLMHELEQFVSVAHRLLDCFTIFLSGEFVIDVDSPKSIFIVLQAFGTDADSLEGEDRWLLSRIFENREWNLSADEELTVTTDLTLTYPEGHSRHNESVIVAMTTRLQASTLVPGTEGHGYLEIIDCEQEELNAIAILQDS